MSDPRMQTQRPMERTGEKQKSLDTAIQAIEKQFGKGAVMRLGESRTAPVESVPTGSLSLDYALGVGGLPRGRIVEIFGPESSGKTTIALHVVAEVQKMGGQAAFVDVEHALDPAYSRILGVDIDNLLIAQPSSGEEALEIAEMLVRSNAVDVLVVDSVAALTTKAEIDGEMGDATVGMQARLMSQAMRKLTPIVSRSGCVCIFINQLREKIGVMFGNPETTPGGRALKFFSSVRLDIRRKEQLKDGDEAVGYTTEVKVVKNKVSPPFRKAHFDIMFGKGLSREGEILDMAEEMKIISKTGAWYSFGDTRIGQGRENAKDFLVKNPDVFSEVALKVKTKLGMIKTTDTAEEKPDQKEKAAGNEREKAAGRGK
ncbi:MAG TPA: recombinase RecA [Candidatus Ozemobacteraceae bacterium]|nr:recombinase RecA [Candidatus Ozemobacteraceae bacterium]